MRAAVLHEFHRPLVLEQRDIPTPGPGEVVLRVEACGVCHSDVHLADADWAQLKAATRLPLVLGHEIAGVVAAAGAGVGSPRTGERAGLAWLNWTCGECEYCASGCENLCLKQRITGVMVDGGYAEFVRAPASHVIPIPDGLSAVDAAPLFCAGLTAYRAVVRSGIQPGERAVVHGVGGLGHLAIQIAAARGAEVWAVDANEEKLSFARECGAVRTLNVTDDPKTVRAHAAVVTTGAAAAYPAAVRALRRGGTLMVVGMPAESISLPVIPLVGGELRVMGSAVGTRAELRELLALAAAGKVRCRVESAPLESVNESLDDLRAGRITGRRVITP